MRADFRKNYGAAIRKVWRASTAHRGRAPSPAPVPYIHELKDWPKFHWSQERLGDRLAAVRHRQGRLIGRMETLGFPLRAEAVLATLTEDVLKSSEIEGEVLDKEQLFVFRDQTSIAEQVFVGRDQQASRQVLRCLSDRGEKAGAHIVNRRYNPWMCTQCLSDRSKQTSADDLSGWRAG